MTQLIEYAVRVRGTQKYLPRSQRRDGRGGSHLEPVDFTDRSSWPRGYEKNMQIRTYTTRSAAENLMRSWVQGKFYASRTGSFEDYDEEIYCKKVPERRIEDLEVVEITLCLPGDST